MRSSALIVATARMARILLFIVLAMLLLRLVTLGAYPLMDTSEARYGEIARIMLAGGDFVTPQEIPGTPFWAKPPLYAWLSAASMQLLGVNEFALRLPSLLCALAVLGLCASWSCSLGPAQAGARDAAPRRALTHAAPAVTLALLATSVLFFVSAGAVMTDPCLALCITAMLTAFHHVAVGGSRARWWRWGFFVATGFGMLAKGPVIMLYAGMPIVLWTLWQRRLSAVWSAFPWVGGTVLAAAICVPWYVLAELHTPGFLRYFLLGEHIMRFLQPGWGGDLYGTAHAEPPGTIWLFLAGGLGLGVVLAAAALVLALRGLARGGVAALAAISPAQGLLLLAAVVPLAFFTFAGNIIWTYALPALGPLAVLVGEVLAPRLAASAHWRRGVLVVFVLAACAVALAVLTWVPRHVARHSSAGLLAQWRDDGALPGSLVYWGRKAPASLRFYSRGQVRAEPELALALQGVDAAHERFLAVAPSLTGEVQKFLAGQLAPTSVEAVASNEDLVILRIRAR